MAISLTLRDFIIERDKPQYRDLTIHCEFTVTHPWISDQRTPLCRIGAPMRRNGWIIAGSIVVAGDAILQETPNRRVLLDYPSRSGSKPASIGGVSRDRMVSQR